MKASIFWALSISFLFVLSVPNAAYCETYTSAAKAGAVYKLQGEYMGVIESWGGTWGAQIVATGENKIDIHLLNGGLPGQGFADRTPSKEMTATLEAGKENAEARNDSVVVTVQPSAINIADTSGKKLGVLSKVVRESSTLGAKPPADALVLFAVGGANNFKDGKIKEDGLLGVGCTSQEKFGDHRLHIEFRTPFQPDDFGQKRGNSGVYVQGRYEVQVLDSFGLKGEDNECGGIYKIAKPRLNMCYPPLTWQTYDIDFTAAKYDASDKKTSNARVTIKHNGIAIHENLELTTGTPGKDKEGSQPGPLFLQDHSNPVVYRNIWVQRK
ncbi:MAG: DUF1080 domain-containing protein [Pirellula sp.]